MMETKRTRPRGFAAWEPRAETLVLVEQIRAVLAEYEAHLPLTIRQVFYRLVGAHCYDKTERSYARLCETMGRARRAGFIPFNAIRDDGGSRFDASGWDSPAHWLASLQGNARRFRLDRQSGQPVRLWLLCEAAGMAPMLAGVAGEYGVPVLSSGGFDSLTAKHDLAQELAQADRAEVLHIGDHDPSGVHVFSSLADDVAAMVRALGGNAPSFTRLAVTREQAEELDLPTAPPKPTDRRAFHGETVQAEAIPPDVLAEIVRAAVMIRQDGATRAALLICEAEARADLLARLGALA